MAKHNAVAKVTMQQDRHQLPVGGFQRRVIVDIELLNRRPVPEGESRKRIAHRVAQVTVGAGEERQLGASPRRRRGPRRAFARLRSELSPRRDHPG
jgi:hypothetical protein